MTIPEQLMLPLPPDRAPAWIEALIERYPDLTEQQVQPGKGRNDE